MKYKLQVALMSLILSTFIFTVFFSFSVSYIFSFFTFCIFVGGALLLIGIPLSCLLDKLNYNIKPILRYLIYLVPGLVLFIYFSQVGILLISSIIATIFFLVEINCKNIKSKTLSKISKVLLIMLIILLSISAIIIGSE